MTGDENTAARLLLACKAGQLQVVMSLLESGRARPDGAGWAELTPADVEGNSGDWHYWRDRVCDWDPTPLHEAAGRGHVEIVGVLLAAGARRNPRASMAKCLLASCVQRPDIFTHEAGGVTPLHLAAQRGQEKVIRVLVEAGASVDILGGALAEPPLHLATRYGHTSAMLVLLRKGADINAGNCSHQTALHEANSTTTLELLLASGADKNGRATRCAKPLRISDTPLGVLVGTTDVRLTSESKAEEATKMVEVLLRHGADASIPVLLAPHDQTGPFVDSAEFLGATTPETSPCCHAPCPAVSWASAVSDWSPETSGTSESWSEIDIAENHPARGRCSPSVESAECLLSSPKSMWVGPPSSPNSLLPRAAENGAPGIVAALLRHGLDPAQQDEHRLTPLHYAAKQGQPAVLRLLLRAGAEVDSATPKERRTPLHVACRRARLGCVLELLRWGANLDALCVLSEDDFGLDSEDEDIYRTPFQVVGWADSRTNRGEHEAEDEIERRHNAIRRALFREDRWRRRGGVVVLRYLLKKNSSLEDDAPPPLSSRSCSRDHANIIPFENCLDSARAPWYDQDPKRGCPTTHGGDTEEGVGGEESDKRQRSVLIPARVDGEGSRSEGGNKTTHALAGLMRLGWIKESLFRKVVWYL